MQLWLSSHLPRKGAFVENQGNFSWPERMTALTEKDISWYSREFDGTEVILRCGGFPNVPLMGPRGCINYNPVLSLRQLGYPMNDKPEDRQLECFILKEGDKDPALIKRIQKAWGQVYKKKMEKKNCVAKPPYTQWVKERVKVIKLRFPVVTCDRPPSPPPITTIPIEEAVKMESKIVELQGKNEEWEAKYLQVEGELARLKRDQKQKEESLQIGKKRLRESEKKQEKIGDGLLSATDNLKAYKEEIKGLEHSYGEVERFWKFAIEAKKKWRLAHEEQVLKTQEVKKRLHLEGHRVREFENLYLQEKAKREHLQNSIQSLLDQHVEAHVNQIALLKEELEVVNTRFTQRGKVLDFV
ncbi:unnamed protein product [Trifolium pratense]|uniref:Uncharacterized protein n=1 Tax=Trifolium pratense TaxID=57577 RepID=A0ACB0IMQ2_TRIPR|nr:unnamed protein product [Trifolium pratense]